MCLLWIKSAPCYEFLELLLAAGEWEKRKQEAEDSTRRKKNSQAHEDSSVWKRETLTRPLQDQNGQENGKSGIHWRTTDHNEGRETAADLLWSEGGRPEIKVNSKSMNACEFCSSTLHLTIMILIVNTACKLLVLTELWSIAMTGGRKKQTIWKKLVEKYQVVMMI